MSTTPNIHPPLPLQGVRILSLSLNLPGPAALQRCSVMGASCLKLEPPAATSDTGSSADPMWTYSPTAYHALHQGIAVQPANLKTEAGQTRLHDELARADVLLTSFRPSALRKLGLDWDTLHPRYPQLSMVTIYGDSGAQAEHPGHDLSYMAQADLLTGLDLPVTLYADMAGALLATEAVLQAVLLQRQQHQGSLHEVALSDGARFLALPHTWGTTAPGTLIGGGHAGYGLYPCQDGRVALAALEPHFARALCLQAGLDWTDFSMMRLPATRERIASFVANLSCQTLNALSAEHDIPLHTMQN